MYNVWVMRLLYSCSELGLGHASRTLALGKRLERNGHEIFFFTGGRAFQLLQREFKNVNPTMPVAWYENAHGIITSASLVNILFPLPVFNSEKGRYEIKSSSAMETTHRYYDLRRHIKEIKPDLIVSDGDIHALRLANRWRFPSVYITNLIRPSFGFSSLLNPGERFTERYVKSCSKIIIPDNPPPFTISEYNIGELESIGIKDKVEFVGSFVDTTLVKGSETHVFAPISGPFGTRAKLTQMLIPAFEELGVKSVVSLGAVGEKKTVQTSNCTVHSWLSAEERQEYMRNAKLVVFSGGHITCFETVKYAKPTVCIPTQPEQMGNGMKLQKLHCSVVARNKEQLKVALRTVEEQMSLYRSSVEKLNEFSNKFNGLERAVEIIEETID
jgi:UDP-N-acetylglucosamine--N-acetylmuramyl-(pentapeptide) pyrophosphoryl-undecaprenol N-acetylglucosamine transferase